MRAISLVLLFMVMAAGAWAQSPAPVAPGPVPITGTPAPAAPSPAPAAGSPAPRPEPIAVIAKGSVARDSCSVGGTLSYTLELTWTAPADRDVVLKPFEPPQAQGLDVIRRSQKSGRTVRTGVVDTKLTTNVVYKCASAGKFSLGPLTIPYEDGSGEQLSTVAPAVSVEVDSGKLAALRKTKSLKYGVFIAGIALFWGIVIIVRRIKKRKPEASEGVKAENRVEGPSVWDALALEAKDRPASDFYARLEEALWKELFRPEPVVPGTTATRIAALSGAGLPGDVIEAARQVVTACQKARFTSGPVSQGDAIMTLRTAREKVVEKLQS